MNKPEYLTGEVEPFEKIVGNVVYNYVSDEHGKNKSFASFPVLNIHEVHQFYTQTFTPDMITEYFGLENISNREPMQSYIIDGYEIILLAGYKQMSISKGKKYFHTFLYPEILSDFIRDCERAGINLTWKE